MTLIDRINKKIIDGYTSEIAESIVGQEIIIEAISISNMVDKTLLKGGIIMYHITSNCRRATRDLDFDLIHYDINSNPNIDLFIEQLNKSIDHFDIHRKGEIITLHQEDYKGKRVYVEIRDNTHSFLIKLDIGIHTLFAIKQTNIEFKVLEGNKTVSILANPIEQVVAEKLYSLVKHGFLSTRYKDIFDIYYLIKNETIDKLLLKKCILLLMKHTKESTMDLSDFCLKINDIFSNSRWLKKFESTDQNWLENKDCKMILTTISNYICSLL